MKHCRAAVAAVNDVVGVAALLSSRNSRDEALLTYEASTLQRKSTCPFTSFTSSGSFLETGIAFSTVSVARVVQKSHDTDNRRTYFLPITVTTPRSRTNITDTAPTSAIVPACHNSHMMIESRLLFGE
jgi:hypothetical protein